MIVALNMVDLAREKGIKIDEEKLSEFLGVPVVSTVGIKGTGIDKLVQAIEIAEGKVRVRPKRVEYGKEIEEKVRELEGLLSEVEIPYSARFVALKLLEGDEKIKTEVLNINSKIVETAEKYARDVEQIHGEPCSVVISSERYAIANKIAKEVLMTTPAK